MPNIRISQLTWERLVAMKSGMDSLDTVVNRLLALYEVETLRKGAQDFDRKAVEAKGEKSSPGPGGERSSEPGKASPDGTSDTYIVECKLRNKLPQWIKDGLATARGHASDTQLGLLILHEKGARDDLVVLSLNDFKEWFGEVKHENKSGGGPR